ncbi:MAG: 2-amino-4-hydroxy-6-hydroxymethyldihydropteridine diphosphokinase [Dehalococcoidia bacterium]|tara:strand:+ start:1126 stop:1608 length:483 start_codon:yes stop_codon:yes gene_type:complete
MENIIISIGSNLGDRKKFLEKSIYLLSKRLKLIDHSSVYETKGFGVNDHPDYLNRVIYFKTNISFFSLLNYTKKIERKLGRFNKNDLTPRIIDIDIIFYGEKKILRKNLILPHKRFSQRSFVIVPFYEIDIKQKKQLSKKFRKFLKTHKDLNFFSRDIIQ